MESQDDSKSPARSRSKSDRWVKIGFVVVAAVVAFIVWRTVRQPKLPGWIPLDEAVEKARKENRPIVVLFMNHPISDGDRWNIEIIAKSANRKAIEEGNFIRAKAQLSTALDSETARRHRIKVLPTVLVLEPEGEELKERNRREGRLGEVDFRQGFLDLARVQKPGEN